jgi:uncharacterized RDD family membrane protein YckC
MAYGTPSAYAPPPFNPPPRDPTNVMGRRTAAYLIDFILVAAIEVALLAATKDHTYILEDGYSNACADIRSMVGADQCLQLGNRAYTWTGGAFLLALGLATLVGLLNNVILQTATGASVGKMIMGLRVVTADGQTAGLGRQFVRWLMLIVDAGLCFVGFFVAAFSHPHRRLGDSVASTYVVASADAGRPLEFPAGLPPAMGQQFGQAFGQQYPQQYGQPGYVPPPPQNTWGQPPPQPGGWNQAPAQPQWGAPPPSPQQPPPWGTAQPAPAQPAQPPVYEPPTPPYPRPTAPPESPPAPDAAVESWWDKAATENEPDDDTPKQ